MHLISEPDRFKHCHLVVTASAAMSTTVEKNGTFTTRDLASALA